MASSLQTLPRTRTARPKGLRPRRPLRRIVGWMLALAGLAGLALLGFVWYVHATTAGAIYTGSDPRLPHNHAALVFGAGLNGQGGPSAVLYDRVATAADLYHRGKVDKLLMSGDNSVPDYNEVGVMRRTAVGLGVPERDIVLDYAGFRTYDSCYRARAIFGLDAATLVTNAYHLPRALYTCRELGLSVAGVPADRQNYPTLYYQLREVPAIAAVRWWLSTDEKPRFLGPPINIDAPPPQP
jgi:vancomycin permeability regulator SanA